MYGGGSTKDIIYLRGIERVLQYFADDQKIDPLLAGKLSLDHAPLVEDLIQQGVLNPPRAHPRWLSAPGAEERLERVRGGMHAVDLLEMDVVACIFYSWSITPRPRSTSTRPPGSRRL